MRAAYDVPAVRAAEEALMRTVPEGALMAQAAAGLARTCASMLDAERGGVVGARVVVLAGSGNNAGDALWAGARLARRGASVLAVLVGGSTHAEGLAALRAAGGRSMAAADEAEGAADRVIGADLVIDGIVGIGASGPLRPPAAELARAALQGGGLRVAVDLPSGIDPGTGAVPDPGAAFVADVTVTFGAPKPGLLLMPAAEHVGVLEVVDIGLGPSLGGPPSLLVLDEIDVALLVPEPGPTDHKYSRGVVGVAAGSRRYPGAALLSTGAARRGGAGMVELLTSDAGLARLVVGDLPDVVLAGAPGDDPRITAWAAGPGLGTGAAEAGTVVAVLGTEGPVLLDADALRLLAEEPRVRAAFDERSAAGRVTVLTPHEGEFARLGYSVGEGAAEDRAGAARRAARELGAVVLLKGATTVVAAPGVVCFATPLAPSVLATAGSGDVLTGLAASMLAHAAAAGPVDHGRAAKVLAGASWLHALAGRLAGEDGRPVAAADLLAALPDAVAMVRAG